jgi:serine/threonine-protein kinase HipA
MMSCHAVTCMLGQAPKLWISRTRDGRFYPDACLAEDDSVERFLVKFPAIAKSRFAGA